MNGAEGIEGVEGVEGAEGVEGVEGVERVEGAERVPKWFQNGPQMVPKVAWKATGGQLVRLMWTRLPLKRALEEHRKKN